MLNRACTFYQRKKCMHMLIWNYNGCTSYLMLLLFGETLVIHRFRERLRERERLNLIHLVLICVQESKMSKSCQLKC